jgi:hypothetical protein
MEDFEKLGTFYLGRTWDPAARAATGGLLLYDSRDLVTHAVCVGMTGSGKTGLCIDLIEEAALDGIPVLAIDPKGDLGNLLLTFPELRAEDFAPWVDADEARRRGLEPADFAARQAETWRQGLAAWGQDGARIRRLRETAELAIYTPGSTAGLPVSIVRSFAAPPPAVRADAEALRDRVGATAASLLGLLGIDADPVRSREHILLATLLDAAWRAGEDLDLGGLVQRIQSPGVSRVGVLDLESFYPARERFALAMALNNLLAAPGFGAWLEGEPLDVDRLLRDASGRPRVAIFSIAHLADPERMFFVSLLLNQTLAWMRGQPGTSSLRAILYMDEIAGYFPPVATPPAKPPLLTLLKQARAYGLGVVLATQNPVDLDYRGLGNTGTWLIGRLQTERDKARLLDGLEGAAGEGRLDRAALDRLLAGLGSRVFLMHNVHDDAPVLFETRWAMSYLRGPLTREQIRRLMAGRPAPAPIGEPPAAGGAAAGGRAPATPAATPGVRAAGAERPVVPPEVPQHFLPVRGARPGDADLAYEPAVLGVATVRLADAKKGVDVTEDVALAAPITDEAVPVDWARATPVAVTLADLEREPANGAAFAALPPAAARAKSYAGWSRDLAAWLHRTHAVELYRSPGLRAFSRPGESERDFRVRLQQTTHEQRDAASDALRRKYAPRIATLQERIRRAEQAVERESQQASQQTLQTAISVGATLLGAFMGRRAVSASTLGRATTAARGAGRVMKESADVGRARETLEALREQLAELEAQFRAETDVIGARVDPLTEPLETVRIRPTRQNIAVRLVALAWRPGWRAAGGAVTPAWE